MKRIYLLITIGLFLTFKIEAKRVEGKIVRVKDTINVTFNIPVGLFTGEIDFEKLQHQIKYFDSTGKKITIKPDQVSEIQFEYRYEEFRILSRKKSSGLDGICSNQDHIFLKLEVDGKLKMFSYYHMESMPMVYSASGSVMTGVYFYPVDKYVLQKENEELMIPGELSFRKEMMEYLKDCPELFRKIENKELRKKDLETIVGFYNSSSLE